ncbi:MAG: response regulator transcription factor [Filimonas sp.]|nr:response regulator transcription factor [Filimonas sp.]
MTKILIADDHTIIRIGIAMIIEELHPSVQIEQVSDFNEVVAILKDKSFDLLILDINIPGGNNLQMIEAIRLRQPDQKILMFTAYDEELFASRYLQAGANGYLVKDSPREEIAKAIQTVLQNEVYVSDTVTQGILQRLTGKAENNYSLSQLSNREMEVLQLLVKGNSITEIAAMLHLGITTINTYKTRILEKLNMKNVVELVSRYPMLVSNKQQLNY